MQAKNVPAIEPIQKQIVDAVLADEKGRGLEPDVVKEAVERLCRRVHEKSARGRWRHAGLGHYYISVEGHSYNYSRRGGGFAHPGFALNIKDGKIKTDRVVRHVIFYVQHQEAIAEKSRAEAGNQGIADELRAQFPAAGHTILASSEAGKVYLDLGRRTLSPDVARAVLALLRDE